jgi:hypothetical protein
VAPKGKETRTQKWKRALNRARLIHEANEKLASFEAQQVFFTNDLHRVFEEDYLRTRLFLKGFIEQEIKHRYTFPIRSTSDLLEFLEKRRSKSMELLVILVAAVIGGIAGGAGGSLLTKADKEIIVVTEGIAMKSPIATAPIVNPSNAPSNVPPVRQLPKGK